MSLLSVSTSSILNASAAFQSEGGGVTVDLDASLVVQIVLFVVLLVVLKPVLFDPMLKLFEEREKRIEGAAAEAREEDKRSAKALSKYEAALAKAREAGNAERDALRSQGQKKEAERLAEVRAAATKTIEQGRAAIAGEAKTARAELAVQANVLGQAIASRVLGREVQS